MDMRYRLNKEVRRICNRVDDEGLPENEAMSFAAHELIEEAQDLLVKTAFTLKGEEFDKINGACIALENTRVAISNCVKKMHQARRMRQREDLQKAHNSNKGA